MKFRKPFILLVTAMCLALFSSVGRADSITLVSNQNPGVTTQVTTTTSADGKTVGFTFTNTSDLALKVRILDVYFSCSSCTATNVKSISFSDPSVQWNGPLDITDPIQFVFSSAAGFSLLNGTGVKFDPLQTVLNRAGAASVASGVTGNVSLTFNAAFFPNGFPANRIVVDYIYQDANGNWQRGVPPANADVPEPTTLFLLGSGLAALGIKARRRKK